MMLLLQMILIVVAREVNEALRNLDLGSKSLYTQLDDDDDEYSYNDAR